MLTKRKILIAIIAVVAIITVGTLIYMRQNTQMMSTITFNRVITFDELHQFNEKYDLEIDSVNVEIWNKGPRTASKTRTLVDFERPDEMRQKVQEIIDKGKDGTYHYFACDGVSSIYVMENDKKLKEIKKDELVYEAKGNFYVFKSEGLRMFPGWEIVVNPGIRETMRTCLIESKIQTLRHIEKRMPN